MKSSPSVASRNTSSICRRNRSRLASPPSTAAHSDIASVSPTGTPGAPARIASTALRWASTKIALIAGTLPISVCPGGNIPMPQPMNETMFGSLIVHARVIESPSWPATRSQNRANRSAVAARSQPPCAATHRGFVKWWNVTTGSMPRSRRPSHIRR